MRPLKPRIEGEWWQIAWQPDLGELTGEKQQTVDFAIWRAADRSWQLWSCIRGTKEPGHTRLFHRWESKEVTDAHWKPMGIAMHADPKVGESVGGLQAPYVFKTGDHFIMFYGDWNHICMATSSDGKQFHRMTDLEGKSGMFGEDTDANTRDPMVIRAGKKWICYYTAFPGRKGAVFARTSNDLRRWSEAKIVSSGGRGGDGPFSAECPHVVYREGMYYLFRTERYGTNNLTHVYRSADALNFGRDEDDKYWAATLPIAAPEVVTDGRSENIAALNVELNGIRIARLRWDPA
jgi:hypothetical protein